MFMNMLLVEPDITPEKGNPVKEPDPNSPDKPVQNPDPTAPKQGEDNKEKNDHTWIKDPNKTDLK